MINNANSPYPALFASTNGGGHALNVKTSGSGSAAFFRSSNPSPSSAAVLVETVQGTGVFSFSNGGMAVFGQTFNNTKPAGYFQAFSANSSAPALLGESRGTGAGVSGTGKTGVSGNGSSFGVFGLSSSGVGVFGNSPSGVAGKFIAGVMDAGNANPALEAITLGKGPAGRFKAGNTTSPALVVEGVIEGIKSDITGTGFAGIFRNLNSTTEGGALYVTSLGRGPTARIVASAGGIAISAGKSRVTVLEITGGADLAERFAVSEDAEPGTVMEINPLRPGALCVARGAYNRRVAGVISGANHLDAGMILAAAPGAKVSRPLALSGRVWVKADASRRAIAPGDLLTTAARAGYAMKVVDHTRAQGAVIGKAMTGLKKGEIGMVLVLINLQ